MPTIKCHPAAGIHLFAFDDSLGFIHLKFPIAYARALVERVCFASTTIRGASANISTQAHAGQQKHSIFWHSIGFFWQD
jgi:hypothetical protein